MSRSEKEKNEQSSGWSTLATVGGMVAAFGLGAYLFGKSEETPQAHSSSSSHHHRPPQPRPKTSVFNHPPEDCLICLESINVARLPCGHYYHHDCIKGWENQQNKSKLTPKCPTCRKTF